MARVALHERATLCYLMLLSVHLVALAQDIQTRIDVVETQPERAALLSMATAAAAPVPVEPGELLMVGAALCGAEGAAALAGAGGLAAGGAGAAARSGTTLLLVDPAPALPAARLWSTLAMYPHEDVIAEAGKALFAAKGWQRAVLLHEGAASRAARLAPHDDVMVLTARALPPPEDEALLRNLLLVLKKSGASKFVVWCEAACCVRLLAAAQRVGLLTERHSYLLLTFDLHTQTLDPYSHGGANITTLRLFDPTSDTLTNFSRDLSTFGFSKPNEEVPSGGGGGGGEVMAPPTALVLAWDAARWAAAALAHLQLPPASLGDCSTGTAAYHADTLLNYLRSEEWSGASGVARWEADGSRRAVRLLVAELRRHGQLVGVGRWSQGEGVTWARDDPPAPPDKPDSMTNRTFTVLIAKKAPYVMMRESAERLSGNERYEGFCIELIEKLAEQLSFNYTFVEQQDRVYGSYNNETKQWTGMMFELMNKSNIDFAITDLTITAEREQAVDFTTPFMNLGISILFKMPKAPEPETFAFLLPFSSGVWLCLGLAYVGTSLLLYLVGRLSPEEWQNPYPCVEDPPALDNQFTLANALWFNLGSVLLQGSEIAPVAYSTRAVASVWWLFALVITSSYTANLATLLAKKSPSDIIKNVEQLAHNDQQIQYGAIAGFSTYTFFQYSQNKLYKEMFEVMKTQEMPTSNEEGIQKVMNGNYAFLMESTTIEYETQRNCDVVQVGDLLDNKGYGIAMKKHSEYRQALNLALLNLQERGVLREMKNKWWNELHGGGRCTAAEERESEKLSMNNFTGLFLVLVVGCALGLAGSLLELAWVAWSRRDPQRSYWRRLGDELRFVFQFERSVKPLRATPSSPSDESVEPSPPAAPPVPETPPQPATRSGSLRSGHWSARRRRSSMAAASARRARHTNNAD